VATGFRRIVSNVEPISYFSYHRISDFSLCSFVLRVYLSQTVDRIDLNFFFGGGGVGVTVGQAHNVLGGQPNCRL